MKARCLRFSLRLIFIVVALLSILLAYRRSLIIVHHRELQAIEALREKGFHVECIERELGLFQRLLILPMPDMVSVSVPRSKKDKVDLKVLKEIRYLSFLRGLNLSGTRVQDDDIELLARHQYLVDIDLSRTRISDAGLQHLSSLKGINNLNLNNTSITDNGLSKLHRHSLIRLELRHCNITDRGVSYLRDAKSLQQLDLSNTQITDEGIATLDSCDRIIFVGLQETSVSSEAIDKIKKLYLHVYILN